ncbi:hypothetical protein [Streptomyces sp. NPDC058632]|uniref:hypothetical protein n=1 Tax=unclassified Streptomyces TaxID=2593676 RepID=UPI0036652F53
MSDRTTDRTPGQDLLPDRAAGPQAAAPVPLPPLPALPPTIGTGTGTGTTPPSAPKDRRVLRAVLRWTAVVAVFAVAGASTAYGITRMERTDVPGLATASDGRWDYPTLTRPPLPSGSPGPFAESNRARAHHADLRSLLLPAPAGAKQDPALRGEDGWLSTDVFLKEYAEKEEREEFRDRLDAHTVRHIAARGWTMPDGTRTRIYLLRFNTGAVVDALVGDGFVPISSPEYRLRGAETSEFDDGFPAEALGDDVRRAVYAETGAYGDEQVRQAYLMAGDTLALVVQSRKGGAEAVPFHQTVVLQGRLLG